MANILELGLLTSRRTRRCDAMTRSGAPCSRIELGVGGRCRNHGGMAARGATLVAGPRMSVEVVKDGTGTLVHFNIARDLAARCIVKRGVLMGAIGRSLQRAVEELG